MVFQCLFKIEFENYLVTNGRNLSFDLQRWDELWTGELPGVCPSSSSDEGEGEDLGEGVPEPASVPMTRSRGVTLIDCALLGRQRLLGSGKSTEACLAQLFKSTFRDKPVEKK